VAFDRAAALRFYAGLFVLYLAVGSPLDRIGRYFFFSVHMAQNMMVAYPGAGLLVAGLPGWLADSVLGRPVPGRVLGAVLRPVPCGAVFMLVLSAWQTPGLFQWALWVDGAHAFEPLSILAASILFWWPILSPSRACPRASVGVRLVYLFLIEVALTGAFTVLFMTDHALYPAYETAPRVTDVLTALDDQRLAGILLSGVSSLVLVGVFGFTFRNWARSEHPGR
jgi:putative membrane protein